MGRGRECESQGIRIHAVTCISGVILGALWGHLTDTGTIGLVSFWAQGFGPPPPWPCAHLPFFPPIGAERTAGTAGSSPVQASPRAHFPIQMVTTAHPGCQICLCSGIQDKMDLVGWGCLEVGGQRNPLFQSLDDFSRASDEWASSG